MARILAIDYGKKRCGIAVTDMLQIIATGLPTIATAELIPFLKQYLTVEKVELLVVGLPYNLKSELMDIEVAIRQKILEIQRVFPDLSIVRQDERYTSKMASASIATSGLNKKARQNKALIDEISAVIILQSYLTKVKNS